MRDFPWRPRLEPNRVLVELARADARLYQLRQQVANLPRRIQELAAERQRIELGRREAEGRFNQAETARRKLETEVAEFRLRKTKSEGRLATLTSTEQYQAVQKEIVSHTQHISQLEDSILEAMGRSEEAQRASEAENARARQAQDALDAQERTLQTDFETAKAGIPAAVAAREAMLGAMEARLRAAYDRILRAKGDAGLAIVTAQSCGICKGVQPPQVLQALRGGVAMQNCQNCGRILVWDPAAA